MYQYILYCDSVSVYRKPTHTDLYLHYNSYHQTSCKERVVSSLFNIAYSIITNKDDLHKENTRIKQLLKENECQESIISKILKRITNNSVQISALKLSAIFLPRQKLKNIIYLGNTLAIFLLK